MEQKDFMELLKLAAETIRGQEKIIAELKEKQTEKSKEKIAADIIQKKIVNEKFSENLKNLDTKTLEELGKISESDKIAELGEGALMSRDGLDPLSQFLYDNADRFDA